jgi:hypothetical protein
MREPKKPKESIQKKTCGWVPGSVLSRIGSHGEREKESSPERGRESKTRLLLQWPEPFRRSEREGERRRLMVAGVREMVRERILPSAISPENWRCTVVRDSASVGWQIRRLVQSILGILRMRMKGREEMGSV